MKKQNKKTFSPNNPPRSRGRPPEHPTQELETTRVPSPNSLPRAGDQIPLSARLRKTTRRSTMLPCCRDHPKNTPIEPEGHHDPCLIQYHAAGSRKLLSAVWPTDSGSTRCQNDDGAPQRHATTTRIEPDWHQAIGSIYSRFPTTPETHKSLGDRLFATPGGHNSQVQYMRRDFIPTCCVRGQHPRARDSRTPEMHTVPEVAMRRLRQRHEIHSPRHALLRVSMNIPGLADTHARADALPEASHGHGIEPRRPTCLDRDDSMAATPEASTGHGLAIRRPRVTPRRGIALEGYTMVQVGLTNRIQRRPRHRRRRRKTTSPHKPHPTTRHPKGHTNPP